VTGAGRSRAIRAAALTVAQGCPACLHTRNISVDVNRKLSRFTYAAASASPQKVVSVLMLQHAIIFAGKTCHVAGHNRKPPAPTDLAVTAAGASRCATAPWPA